MSNAAFSFTEILQDLPVWTSKNLAHIRILVIMPYTSIILRSQTGMKVSGGSILDNILVHLYKDTAFGV